MHSLPTHVWPATLTYYTSSVTNDLITRHDNACIMHPCMALTPSHNAHDRSTTAHGYACPTNSCTKPTLTNPVHPSYDRTWRCTHSPLMSGSTTLTHDTILEHLAWLQYIAPHTAYINALIWHTHALYLYAALKHVAMHINDNPRTIHPCMTLTHSHTTLIYIDTTNTLR